MSEQEYQRDAVKFIGIGFNDACTNFLVRFHSSDFDHLKQAISNVASYNAFDGPKVAKAFAKIERFARHASFGREGSPVLYIELKRENVDARGANYNPGAPIGSKEVFTAFEALGMVSPDEANADTFNKALLRFWWD